MGDFESAFFDIIFEKPKKLRKGIRMRTIQLQISDSIYDQITTSGMDIQARFDEFVAELIDDGYPSISKQEAHKRVCEGVERYQN